MSEDSTEFLTRLREGENKAWKALNSALIKKDDTAWKALVYLLQEGQKKERKEPEESERRACEGLFLILWKPLNSYLRGLLGKRTHSEAIADDLALETICKAIIKIDQFTGDTSSFTNSFWKWVYTIAKNTFLSYLRKGQLDPISLDDLPGSLHIRDEQSNPEDDYYQKELEEAYKRWVETLPKADKQLWMLRYGKTEREVADSLNVSEEVVRDLFTKLRKNLQKKNYLTEQDIADLLKEKLGKVSARLSHLKEAFRKFLQPYRNHLDQWEWQGMQVVPDSSDGVVVKGVGARSPAKGSGMEIGDLILEVGGRRVLNVNMFAKIVNELDTSLSVKITIRRGHREKKIRLCCRKNGRRRH